MNDINYWQRKMVGHGLSRRTFLRSAAVTGVGAAAFLAGCKSTSSTPAAGGSTGGSSASASNIFAVPEGKRGGTITDVGLDPTTGWDPHATISYLTNNVTEPTGIKLIRHDYRKTPPFFSGNEELIIGELAEKWESPDPLTYNLTIRKGINWPDLDPMKGAPITAQDVKYTFEHAKLATSQVQEYVFNNIKSITAIDDYTVQIKANYPNWRFAIDLDSYNTMIMPKGIYEWAGGDLKDPAKARGGGPWMVDDYQPGSVIRFKANEAYRKVFGVPYADRLNVAILATGAPRLQAWVAKQTQFFTPATGQVDAGKKARPDAKTVDDFYAPTSTNALFMKINQKPFDDIRVRRAMSMAVDRDGWGKTLQRAYQLESGPITWGFPTWKLALDKMPADTQKWAKYDPAEAKKLVDAAGVPAKTYVMHMYPYDSSYTPESQLLQDSLKKVGINTSVKIYEYNNWLSSAYIGKYDDLLYGPDNLDRITQQLADRLLKGSSRNHSDVSDDDAQKLLTQFQAAKGAQDAKQFSDQLQIRSVDQTYAVYRPQGTTPHSWDAAIQNYGEKGDLAMYYQNYYRDAFYWLA